MSVSYEAVIVVGLPQSQVTNKQLIEDDDLNLWSTSYDGIDDSTIAGLCYASSGDYSWTKLCWDEDKLNKLKERFKKMTGQDANVYLSTYGC